MLQHQVEVLPVLVHVVQTQHVLVLDQLHDGDLALHLLQHRLTELLLVDDLDGHLLAEDAVGAQLDQAWGEVSDGYFEGKEEGKGRGEN